MIYPGEFKDKEDKKRLEESRARGCVFPKACCSYLQNMLTSFFSEDYNGIRLFYFHVNDRELYIHFCPFCGHKVEVEE